MTVRWVAPVVLSLIAGTTGAQDEVALRSDKDKRSYALGQLLASRLRAQSLDVDPALVSRAIRDSLSGATPLLTEAQAHDILAAYQGQLKADAASGPPALPLGRAGRLRVLKELADNNRQQGEAFLAENRTKPDVVALDSGLQYKILKPGTGRTPGLGDKVVCHYRGTLVDGTEFDSSYRRGTPATFAVNQVIKGWTEALRRMAVGSRWQLFVPASLAYGERGAGRLVGPNATLVFDVELLAIEDPPAAGAAPAAPAPATASLATATANRFTVAFKLDPRLSGGTYGGVRWVSPPTYTSVGEGRTCSVEARVQGFDTAARLKATSPTWTPADPSMVTATPMPGGLVTMTVHGPGESHVRVTWEGTAKDLTIRAAYRNDVLQAEFQQD